MRKQYTPEDLAMTFQWLVSFMLAPFVLLPLFPRQQITFNTRLSIVVGALVVSAVMTPIYLHARKASRRAAAQVVNVVAVLDGGLVLAVLLIWPRYLPGAFWILTLLVVIVAARFGYKEAAVTAVGFSVLYAVTIVAGYGAALNRSIVGDAAFRILLMLMITGAVTYLTQRERRERREARVLSRVAAAIGATLDIDELMDTVVQGISEATGLGRCTAFIISADGRWAVPKSTTEKDQDLRDELLRNRIDLKRRNLAGRAVEAGEPILADDTVSEPLIEIKGQEAFWSDYPMVLPIMLRGSAKGIVVVEKRAGKKRFSEREIRTCINVVAQAAAGLENAQRYADEQRKRSEADTLYQASRELSSTLDMEQVLENACRLAARNTGTSGAAAFLLDEAGETLVPRMMIASGARRVAFPPVDGMSLRDFEELYNLSQRPPAILLGDPSENPALPDFLRSAATLLVAPLYLRGSIGGMLCVTGMEAREFDELQVSRFALMTSEVSLAVLNATLHQSIKAHAAQMASLIQLANAIGSAADLPRILRLALDSMRYLFNCSSGLIYRIDESDETMRCVESFGYPEEILERISSPPYPRTAECWTVSAGQLIAVDDLSRTKVACRTLEKFRRGSTICVAMQAEGRTLGVLHIRSERPNAFGEEDQQLALAFADQVGIALQRALLFEEINRLAITDPLTGVFNVRRLESSLEDEISRARRYKRPVSFLMADVDNLKAYNDSLGHQQGDVVLSQVASIIDSSTRDVDKVFRYGGDEFCVILPETDSAEAMVVADKIRRSIADFHFPGEEKIPDESITVSVGVASFPKDCDDESLLIHKADLALYAAKQTGRNSVASAF